MPKGNPNPVQTEAFKLHTYRPKSPTYSKEPLAPKPTMVRLAQNITDAIDNLGANKTPWLRRVISLAAYQELLPDQSLADIPDEPVVAPPNFEAELLALAIEHSGRAKPSKSWLVFIDKMLVYGDFHSLPDKRELEAIARKCIKKSELPQAWINFIDEITEKQK
ncbi:MAG: hypothetical protein SFT94_05850 [Pseudanabaenaceae cyanobacterium bins.68]|nr:hypothetical protein [Pseudanabaenaceae cyanobacterium bins.68]